MDIFKFIEKFIPEKWQQSLILVVFFSMMGFGLGKYINQYKIDYCEDEIKRVKSSSNFQIERLNDEISNLKNAPLAALFKDFSITSEQLAYIKSHRQPIAEALLIVAQEYCNTSNSDSSEALLNVANILQPNVDRYQTYKIVAAPSATQGKVVSSCSTSLQPRSWNEPSTQVVPSPIFNQIENGGKILTTNASASLSTLTCWWAKPRPYELDGKVACGTIYVAK